MTFRPDRFIDQDGELLNPEEFIPFSLGKRICLGKAMANVELFLYLANMLQKFEFRPVDPAQLPTLNYVFGQTVYPTKYQLLIVSRFG
ncbi:cytochrome P450 2U1 [Biomphalaria glabrata]